MRRGLIAIWVCLWSTLALGQSRPLETAKDLQTACTAAMNVFEKDGVASAQDAAQYGKCLGYVEGVLDSMRTLSQTGKDGKPYNFHLHGDGYVVKDAVVFFLDFMKNDKEYDHDGPAAPMVIRSLISNHLVTTSVEVQGNE